MRTQPTHINGRATDDYIREQRAKATKVVYDHLDDIRDGIETLKGLGFTIHNAREGMAMRYMDEAKTDLATMYSAIRREVA